MKARAGGRATLIQRFLCRLITALTCIGAAGATAQADQNLARQFQNLDRSTSWQLLDSVPLQFDTYHPQGLVRAGGHFFLSSVEILEPTRRVAGSDGGPDRTAGRGVGHLFKFRPDGTLLASVKLGDGSRYHPGGIDYDGQWIWVSVAEYRPDSQSLVYRVDPETLQAELVFEFADHLGAIVHDRDTGTLVAASWGSRRLYKWNVESRAWADPETQENRSHYVDLQDCQSLPGQQMLCGGIASMGAGDGSRTVIGGLELIDLQTLRAIHQLPVVATTRAGTAMTRNPIYLSTDADGLLFFAAPEDDRSQLYSYRLNPGI